MNPASIKQFIITVATASVTPTTGAVIAALNSTAVKSSIVVHSSSFGELTGRPKTNLRLPNCVGLRALTKQAIPSSQFGSGSGPGGIYGGIISDFVVIILICINTVYCCTKTTKEAVCINASVVNIIGF